METKDWILLLVPIISNGVLLVIFQEVLKRRFEKSDKIRDIEDRFNRNVFEIIQKYNEIIIISNRSTPQTLLDQIDVFGQELWGLRSYVKSYNILRRKYEKNMDECVDLYNGIVIALKKDLLDEAKYKFEIIETILRNVLNKSIS